jgi:hypothetical protein
MKHFCVRSVFALMLAAAPLAVHAQSNLRVVFHAPFSFVAGTKTMPAGAYQVVEEDNRVLMIQAIGNPGAAAVIVYPVAEGRFNGGALNFVHRGGVYYLDTVQIGDGRTVRLTKQAGEK